MRGSSQGIHDTCCQHFFSREDTLSRECPLRDGWSGNPVSPAQNLPPRVRHGTRVWVTFHWPPADQGYLAEYPLSQKQQAAKAKASDKPLRLGRGWKFTVGSRLGGLGWSWSVLTWDRQDMFLCYIPCAIQIYPPLYKYTDRQTTDQVAGSQAIKIYYKTNYGSRAKLSRMVNINGPHCDYLMSKMSAWVHLTSKQLYTGGMQNLSCNSWITAWTYSHKIIDSQDYWMFNYHSIMPFKRIT